MSAFMLLVVTTLAFAQDRVSPECDTWQLCKQAALDAAQAGEYERFHDLAWRAVQRGPKNDGALMTLLARAQSLSGRPHDALVMLQRLAAMGVATDAATSEDFARVRALPGWSAFSERVAETTGDASAERPSEPAAGASRPATRPSPTPPTPVGNPPPSASSPTEAENRPTVPAKVPAKPEPVVGKATEALRFTTRPYTPAGLAYDAVSNRFIVGDRQARKLTVVGERSQRVANLASTLTAGFGEIAALEIDTREGDLWVVSASDDLGPVSQLHKLQLISGRLLFTVPLPETFGPARFVDVAVAPGGTVLMLDGTGRRLFELASGSREVEVVKELEVSAPVSLAPAASGIVYIAHAGGLVRLEQTSGTVEPVTSPDDVSLERLEWIRWHHRSIVGIQRETDGTFRVVSIRFDRSGRAASQLDVLDRGLAMTDPTAASLSADTLYYLTDSAGPIGSDDVESIVKSVIIK